MLLNISDRIEIGCREMTDIKIDADVFREGHNGLKASRRGEFLRVFDIRVAVTAPHDLVFIGKWSDALSEAHSRPRGDRFYAERLRHLEGILHVVIGRCHALVKAKDLEINTSVIELPLDGLEGVERSRHPPFAQCFLLLALGLLL